MRWLCALWLRSLVLAVDAQLRRRRDARRHSYPASRAAAHRDVALGLLPRFALRRDGERFLYTRPRPPRPPRPLLPRTRPPRPQVCSCPRSPQETRMHVAAGLVPRYALFREVRGCAPRMRAGAAWHSAGPGRTWSEVPLVRALPFLEERETQPPPPPPPPPDEDVPESVVTREEEPGVVKTEEERYLRRSMSMLEVRLGTLVGASDDGDDDVPDGDWYLEMFGKGEDEGEDEQESQDELEDEDEDHAGEDGEEETDAHINPPETESSPMEEAGKQSDGVITPRSTVGEGPRIMKRGVR